MVGKICANNAKDLVLINLEKQNYKWTRVDSINFGRYWLVSGTPNIAIIYKQAWFLKFGDLAKEKHWERAGVQETGLGDSINKHELKTMLQNNVKDIFIVYQPHGSRTSEIFSIGLHDFLINSHDYNNKEGKEVKSISIHLYKRFSNSDKREGVQSKMLPLDFGGCKVVQSEGDVV